MHEELVLYYYTHMPVIASRVSNVIQPRIIASNTANAGLNGRSKPKIFILKAILVCRMPSDDRRKLLKGIGALGLGSIAGCVGDDTSNGENQNQEDNSGDSESDTNTDNNGGGDSPHQVGLSMTFGGGSWITAFRDGVRLYTQDQNFDYNFFGSDREPAQEIQDIRTMVNQGYDGILSKPLDSQAVASVVEEASDDDVPTFTLDTDIISEDVAMFTAFSNRQAAETAGETLIEITRDANPEQDSFQVLDIIGTQGAQITRDRDEPFVQLMEETDGFEVAARLRGEYRVEPSQQATQEWVNANGPPDAIYTANLTMAIGALNALDNLDLAHPRGHDDHIVIVTIDAGPQVITKIEDGLVDAAIDQPNYFYGPIALHYMDKYLSGEGEAELPEVGEEITADDLTIESAEHEINGETVELWSDPIWAPAQIKEKNGHRYFETNNIVVTQDNADAAYLWGNIWG
jgi:ribose transport system substrate-binding protein